MSATLPLLSSSFLTLPLYCYISPLLFTLLNTFPTSSNIYLCLPLYGNTVFLIATVLGWECNCCLFFSVAFTDED